MVAAFIRKLVQILNNESQDVIAWAEDGASFHIHDRKTFETNILPKYYRHRKFTSFQRQLLFYEFHLFEPLIGHKTADWQYGRSYFHRDHPGQVHRIHRVTHRAHDRLHSPVQNNPNPHPHLLQDLHPDQINSIYHIHPHLNWSAPRSPSSPTIQNSEYQPHPSVSEQQRPEQQHPEDHTHFKACITNPNPSHEERIVGYPPQLHHYGRFVQLLSYQAKQRQVQMQECEENNSCRIEQLAAVAAAITEHTRRRYENNKHQLQFVLN